MLQHCSVSVVIVMMEAQPMQFAHVLVTAIWQGYGDMLILHRAPVFQLSAGQLRRSPGCWDECQMGGRYVYEFKILIFFQCFHMLFMEWQEK